MMSKDIIRVLLFFILSHGCYGQDFLEPEEFYLGIQEGRFDAVVDVRRQDEWDAGHIEGATFVMNLASDGNATRLVGCESCTLAVYCRSGSRAGAAIVRLQQEFGFENALLYNARGTSQWTDAGYPLVADPKSVDAQCTKAGYVCVPKPSPPPSSSPPTNVFVWIFTIIATTFFFYEAA